MKKNVENRENYVKLVDIIIYKEKILEILAGGDVIVPNLLST